jgi:ABC-type dipeptide/oligopeptide/nickel transport system permease subunit
MAANTEIDTTAAGTGLASEAESRAQVLAASGVTLPVGTYVMGTNALGEGLVTAHLAGMTTRVTSGAAAAAASVTAYEATEDANAAALKTT